MCTVTVNRTRSPHVTCTVTVKGFSLEAVIVSASQRIYQLFMTVGSSHQSTQDPTARTASSRHSPMHLMCQQVAVWCGAVTHPSCLPHAKHVPPIARLLVLRPNKIAWHYSTNWLLFCVDVTPYSVAAVTCCLWCQRVSVPYVVRADWYRAARLHSVTADSAVVFMLTVVRLSTLLFRQLHNVAVRPTDRPTAGTAHIPTVLLHSTSLNIQQAAYRLPLL